MKVDDYLVGETIYCKKPYAINNTDSIPIGKIGKVLSVWNLNTYRIGFEADVNAKHFSYDEYFWIEYVKFDIFDNYFCTLREYRKLKLEKINESSEQV